MLHNSASVCCMHFSDEHKHHFSKLSSMAFAQIRTPLRNILIRFSFHNKNLESTKLALELQQRAQINSQHLVVLSEPRPHRTDERRGRRRRDGNFTQHQTTCFLKLQPEKKVEWNQGHDESTGPDASDSSSRSSIAQVACLLWKCADSLSHAHTHNFYDYNDSCLKTAKSV